MNPGEIVIITWYKGPIPGTVLSAKNRDRDKVLIRFCTVPDTTPITKWCNRHELQSTHCSIGKRYAK